jgi:circadian clock protein KaiB
MKGRAAKRDPTGDGRRPAKLWRLRLHVTGRTPRPLAASANPKTTCETHREGRHRISLIDLLELPRLANGGRILAIPRVARRLPPPPGPSSATSSARARLLVGPDPRSAV